MQILQGGTSWNSILDTTLDGSSHYLRNFKLTTDASLLARNFKCYVMVSIMNDNTRYIGPLHDYISWKNICGGVVKSFFPPAAPFLSCNLSQFRKSEKWKIFPLPTADTWLPPIGLRGWLDGEKSPFPSPAISSLSPSTPWAPSVPPFLEPDCPARLASWAMAGPSHPAFPPGLARTPRLHPLS